MKKIFLILFAMALVFATAAFASPPDKKVSRDVAVSICHSINFNMNAIDVETIGLGNTAIAVPASTVERQIVIAAAPPILAESASDYQPAYSYVSVIAGNPILYTSMIAKAHVIAYNPRGRTQALANDQGSAYSDNYMSS